MLPDSKSAPLACCALMILSVSSIRVGINLSAMVIMSAISWLGSPILENGFSSFSSPSVSSIGLVVSVRIDDPMISSTSLTAMKKALARPSYVMVRNFQCHSTLPSTMKRFSRKVNAIMRNTAVSPLNMNLSGTLDIAMTMKSAAAAIRKP